MHIVSKTLINKDIIKKVTTNLTLRSYIVFIVFGILELISTILMLIVGGKEFIAISIMLMLFGIILLILPFINIIVSNKNIDKTYKDDNILYEYELNDSGINIKIEDVKVFKEYYNFKKVKRVKNYLIIYLDLDTSYIIDINDLDESNIKEIISKINKKVI